jgi:hypothetical protein
MQPPQQNRRDHRRLHVRVKLAGANQRVLIASAGSGAFGAVTANPSDDADDHGDNQTNEQHFNVSVEARAGSVSARATPSRRNAAAR